MKKERDFIVEKLQEAGVHGKIHDSLKSLKNCNEVHVGAVLRSGERVSRSKSKKIYEDQAGQRITRKKLFERITVLHVVIGEYNEEKVENILKQSSLYLQVHHCLENEYCQETVDEMVKALSDDLNTSLALTQILGQVKVLNQLMRVKDNDNIMISKGYQTLVKMLDTMGFLHETKVLSEADIALYQNWQKKKSEKNFEQADLLRKELQDKGII